jgi:predicted dehydrogenase
MNVYKNIAHLKYGGEIMKKYVIVGASSRGLEMYAKPITTELKDYAQLVGVYDTNSIRAQVLSKECGNIPIYANLNNMLEKAKPDVVIVTTIDKFHHGYIIKALEAGYDVISEKPMTIDAKKRPVYIKELLK